MAFAELYRRQVALLIRALPIVAREQCCAFKGGTAINLFVRDMPRLSVDIDLTYLPVQERAASFTAIGAAMEHIAATVRATSGAPDHKATPRALSQSLFFAPSGVQIKIEVTPVLRGCVSEPERRSVSDRLSGNLDSPDAACVVPGPLRRQVVAALDRQHPRDHFDVRNLLANEGIDDNLRKAFVVYLLSHDRPMSEVLAPTRKDISQEFMRGFGGMTDAPVTIDELIAAREALIADIVRNMPSAHRRFLVSFERGSPSGPCSVCQPPPNCRCQMAAIESQQAIGRQTRRARCKTRRGSVRVILAPCQWQNRPRPARVAVRYESVGPSLRASLRRSLRRLTCC